MSKSKLGLTAAGVLIAGLLLVAVITNRLPTGPQQPGADLGVQQPVADLIPARLYEQAVEFSNANDARPHYMMVVENCQRILKDYPESPQAPGALTCEVQHGRQAA